MDLPQLRREVKMSVICVNKMISDAETGAQYLVLWVAPGNEYGYWYDLGSHKPGRFNYRDVLAGEASGLYEIQEFTPAIPIRTEISLNDAERQRRDKQWLIIQAAVDDEPDIYDKKCRLSILKRVATANNINPTNLYPLLDKYWRSGKSKNAFVPQYANCGAQGKERKYSGRGFETSSCGKTLTDADRKNFTAAVNK